MQEQIVINGIKVPVVVEDGERYYPVSYVNQKLFGFQKITGSILIKRGYNCRKLKVDYETQSIESNCLIESEFIKWLKNKKIKEIHKNNMMGNYNELIGMLDMENSLALVNNLEISYSEWLKIDKCVYNEYELDSIKCFYEDYDKDIKLWLCKNCGKYFPVNESYYYHNNLHKRYDVNKCKSCIGCINHIDENKHDIYKKYGINGYKTYYIDKNMRIFAYEYGKNKYSNMSDFETQCGLFDRWCENNKDLVIDKIYGTHYGKFLSRVKLRNMYRDYIEFAKRYHGLNLVGYKFKTLPSVHYDLKENRIEDLKHFIEVDMNIIPSKIPIYITKMTFQNNCRKLYYVMRKYYNSSIYNYINDAYPDMFEPEDFNVKLKRNKFDSKDERIIDDYLREMFGSNLIYNNGDHKTRFKIGKYQPDWILLRDDKVIIIEYFGMYIIKKIDKSTMIKEYCEKTELKIEHYSSMDYYDFIYFIPDDLKDNFRGIDAKVMRLCK